MWLINIPNSHSNLTLTAFHVEIASNTDYSKMVLNVLYSHTAIQWQIGKSIKKLVRKRIFCLSLLDTLLCSLNIFLDIIMEVKHPLVGLITQILFTTDYILNSLNLVCIGLARVTKHVKTDLYLDLGTEYNWNIVIPINISIAVATQVITFFVCETIESQCFEITIAAVLMTILFIAFLLHLFVWMQLLIRYFKGQTQVFPYYSEASKDIINFSIGSYTLLILALVVLILSVIFVVLKLPLTSAYGSIVQLLNITIVSVYWTFSNYRIKKVELQILRNIFYQDNSFTVRV